MTRFATCLLGKFLLATEFRRQEFWEAQIIRFAVERKRFLSGEYCICDAKKVTWSRKIEFNHKEPIIAEPLAVASGCYGQLLFQQWLTVVGHDIGNRTFLMPQLTVASAGYREWFCN